MDRVDIKCKFWKYKIVLNLAYGVGIELNSFLWGGHGFENTYEKRRKVPHALKSWFCRNEFGWKSENWDDGFDVVN